MRGPRGGYELARERRRISANDVLRAARTLDEDSGSELPKSRLLSEVVMPAVVQAEKDFVAALTRITIEELARRAASFKNLLA